MELVDGKQRVSAVLEFFDNLIPVFGCYYREYLDTPDILVARFSWYVHDLDDSRDVIKWYLDMNTGGSIHTEKDLEPARRMLAEFERRKYET